MIKTRIELTSYVTEYGLLTFSHKFEYLCQLKEVNVAACWLRQIIWNRRELLYDSSNWYGISTMKPGDLLEIKVEPCGDLPVVALFVERDQPGTQSEKKDSFLNQLKKRKVDTLGLGEKSQKNRREYLDKLQKMIAKQQDTPLKPRPRAEPTRFSELDIEEDDE